MAQKIIKGFLFPVIIIIRTSNAVKELLALEGPGKSGQESCKLLPLLNPQEVNKNTSYPWKKSGEPVDLENIPPFFWAISYTSLTWIILRPFWASFPLGFAMAFVKAQGVQLVLRKTIGEIKSECTAATGGRLNGRMVQPFWETRTSIENIPLFIGIFWNLVCTCLYIRIELLYTIWFWTI